jgi:hypothetical protein
VLIGGYRIDFLIHLSTVVCCFLVRLLQHLSANFPVRDTWNSNCAKNRTTIFFIVKKEETSHPTFLFNQIVFVCFIFPPDQGLGKSGRRQGGEGNAKMRDSIRFD